VHPSGAKKNAPEDTVPGIIRETILLREFFRGEFSKVNKNGSF
jgi:hypothetical protein